jgi:biliverdin reductase / flavin reductase
VSLDAISASFCHRVDQPEKYPLAFRLFIRPMLGRHFDSMFIMEEYLEKQCQDLEYTIVRPPRLTDESIIGRRRQINRCSSRLVTFVYLDKDVQVCENDYFFPDQSTGMRLPRANVARFMLDILHEKKFIRQGVAIDMSKN